MVATIAAGGCATSTTIGCSSGRAPRASLNWLSSRATGHEVLVPLGEALVDQLARSLEIDQHPRRGGRR